MFMQPYAKEFKANEKAWHKAYGWNERATLRAQHMGMAVGQTQNARRAQAASTHTSKELDDSSIKIMVAYHRHFEGWEFSSLPEMNDAITDKEWGTGKKIEELGEALAKEKNGMARKAKLPVSLISLAMMTLCAITGHFAAAVIIALIGVSLVLGIAGLVTDRLFSRRERALSIWQKAAARVRGLVENGNGNDAMNEVVEEKAIKDGLLDNISLN